MKHRTKVLITGGASGLGRELVRRYARRGCEVLVLDVDREGGSALLRESDRYQGFDGVIRFAHLDLVRFDHAKAAPELSRALSEGGPFDIVILNAGISNSDDFLKTSRKLDETIMAVNLIGHMQLIKLLLKGDRIVRGGRLGLVASASLYLPFPIALAYAASKAAVSGLAHALEPYVRGHGISVTCVYPGPLKTPHARKYYKRFDEGRGGDPERVAGAVERAVRWRFRRARPDGISRVFHWLSVIAPGLLVRMVHAKYRGELYGSSGAN